LSASHPGNARSVADSLHANLPAAGVEARLSSGGDFKSITLPDDDIVLLVTSTHGEGEPPEDALPLYKFIYGKKIPD
ncbi:flavodoxin domain-containing protein, partial [Neisseria sp. P0015.S004]